MSEHPFKVEQWSKGFTGVTKLILETAVPNEAHAEFERRVKSRCRPAAIVLGFYCALTGLSGLYRPL